MIERRTWEEFRSSKLLWWVNRSLHIFGWSIVYESDSDGNIISAYPARSSYRGFSEQSEASGFTGLTRHLNDTMPQLLEDVSEDTDGAG